MHDTWKAAHDAEQQKMLDEKMAVLGPDGAKPNQVGFVAFGWLVPVDCANLNWTSQRCYICPPGSDTGSENGKAGTKVTSSSSPDAS